MANRPADLMRKPPVVHCLGPRCENEEMIDALWNFYRLSQKSLMTFTGKIVCSICAQQNHAIGCPAERVESLRRESATAKETA